MVARTPVVTTAVPMVVPMVARTAVPITALAARAKVLPMVARTLMVTTAVPTAVPTVARTVRPEDHGADGPVTR